LVVRFDRVIPQAEAADEGIVIAAANGVLRQRVETFDVAAADTT
jgi:hypothetical protein